MEEEKIVGAIDRARKGISQYLEIMNEIFAVNVAENRNFQRKFNAFYRVRQRPQAWYQAYFSHLERCKGRKPLFDEVIDEMYRLTGRYEPSFASKFVATLDPEQPVWDTWVLRNTGTKAPGYYSPTKLAGAKTAYKVIQRWYCEFLRSAEGRLVVELFDRMVAEHHQITDTKKIDFVLWQARTG